MHQKRLVVELCSGPLKRLMALPQGWDLMNLLHCREGHKEKEVERKRRNGEEMGNCEGKGGWRGTRFHTHTSLPHFQPRRVLTVQT